MHLCAINLSALTVEDDTFAQFVLERLQRYGVPPDKVCFEITETAAVASMVRVVELMAALRSAGCKFSLDDFGAGMASFGYLKNLPVDYVKIDGSFIRNIETDPVSYSIVRAVTDIGHQLGWRSSPNGSAMHARWKSCAASASTMPRAISCTSPSPRPAFASAPAQTCWLPGAVTHARRKARSDGEMSMKRKPVQTWPGAAAGSDHSSCAPTSMAWSMPAARR